MDAPCEEGRTRERPVGGSGQDRGSECVCVGAILERAGRVLLVRRAAGREWLPGVWDLPGGHRERGESPEAALLRELTEELDVTALEWRLLATATGESVTLHVYRVPRRSGSPRNAQPKEHDAIAWLSPDQLDGISLADARLHVLILRALEA
jgi:8-oxo-dGTP diphosphatase